LRRSSTAGVLVLVLAAGALLLVLLLRPWSFSRSGAAVQPAPRAELPLLVKPAFVVPTPRPLVPDRSARWAPVLRTVLARRRPSSGSTAIARVDRLTPEGTTNIVLVVSGGREREGRLWVRARLATLPNNSTGWVPRDAIGGYVAVRTRLVVDLEHFRAGLFRSGRRIFTAEVGVGKPESPTPRGQFYIRNVLTRFKSPFYGPVAFGTSARSSALTDWPDGGFVGIHGTNEPELLPGRVSHGCIRMRNRDILELARLMPVGTPVTIR
jgi:hypothetical protein